MHKIAIFGDSYVARLRDSDYADLFLPGATVRYFGKGGLTLEKVQGHVEWRRMTSWKPTHVFFHCGGNSFSSTKTPEELFEQISRLISRLSPATVFVGEVLPRGTTKEWTGLTPATFNDFRVSFNSLLIQEYGQRCIPFYLQSVTKPDGTLSQYYRSDRIHMSEPIGIKKYRKVIRRCFNH